MIKKGSEIKRREIVYTETEVLYLRKANQIHGYIVNEYAKDGEDNCTEIDISLEDIKHLKELCEKVIKESILEKMVLKGGFGCESHKKDEAIIFMKIDRENDKILEIKQGKVSDLKVGDVFVENDAPTKDVAKKVEDIRIGEDGSIRIIWDEWYLGKGIKNPELAQELLPTTSGFFFGSTEYDEYYLEDLKSYIKQADEIIKEHQELLDKGVKEYDIGYYYFASY